MIKTWLSAILLSALTVLGTQSAAAAGNVTNGKALFNGTLAGSYPCQGCHNLSNADDPARLGSDPGNIVYAIQTFPEMGPLFGIGGAFELSSVDINDLAAYIATQVTTATPPAFVATPTLKNYGSVVVNASSGTTTFTIKNTGGAGSVTAVSSTNASEFPLQGGTCLSTPKALAQNETCTITAAFAPTSTGARSSSIQIVVSAGTPNPLSIALSGTGASGVPGPGQLDVPATLSLGSKTVGTQGATATVSIGNVGATAVVISSVTNSNTPEFLLLANNCSGSIASGASCTLSVAFKPGTAGARTGTITISSNGTGSPQTMVMSGTGTTGSSGTGTITRVIEFYHAAFDHYFLTPEIIGESVLMGKPPFADWLPTGRVFNGYVNAGAPANSVPVCRFFNDSFAPKSSHFYALHGLGCEATIAKFPDWQLESSNLFNMLLPDANGSCPGTSIPVYRLYNNGMGGAPNHRFVTSLTDRAAMVAKGYVPEGFGALGVGMCSPQ